MLILCTSPAASWLIWPHRQGPPSAGTPRGELWQAELSSPWLVSLLPLSAVKGLQKSQVCLGRERGALLLGSQHGAGLRSGPQDQHMLQHHRRVLWVAVVGEESPLPNSCGLPGCRNRRSSYVLVASSLSRARRGELLLLRLAKPK